MKQYIFTLLLLFPHSLFFSQPVELNLPAQKKKRTATKSPNPNMKQLLQYLSWEYWGVYASALVIWLANFVAPVWYTILLVFFMVVVDLFTGIRAARFRGEAINSKGLRRTVEKITIYTLYILALHGIQLVYELPNVVVYVLSGVIVVTELLSISENIEIVTGVPLVRHVRKIFSKFIK